MNEETKDATPALYLLRVEAQNFNWIVYDTHDLSTIAGGSRLLAMVPETIANFLDAAKELKALRRIQLAASIGLFAIYAERNKFSRVLEQVKEKLAAPPLHHLTVDVGAIEIPDVTLLPDGDGKYNIADDVLAGIDTRSVDRLQASARFAQMRASNVSIPSVQPGVNVACTIDHVRPATGLGKRAMSLSTEARRKEGKAFRWQKDGKDEPTPTVETFEEMTDDRDRDRSRRDGRLAVIHIDGKEFTKVRGKLCTNAANLAWFSKALTDLQEVFHSELMAGWTKDSKNSRYFFYYDPKNDPEKRRDKAGWLLRFQRLITAGDDATYLMPAWLAWEFLERFFTWNWKLVPTTPEQTDALQGCCGKGLTAEGKLTFRAGVVICHAKAPIHPILDLAHKLESEVAAEDGESLEHPIAYEVLKSFDFIGAGLSKYRERKRAGLSPIDVLLDGKDLRKQDGADRSSLHLRLETGNDKIRSGDIKNPACWSRIKEKYGPIIPNDFIPSDAFHLSQLRDYIF